MVNLVLVQTDSAGQIDLDLVSGGDAVDQVGTAHPKLLCDRHQRSDVVTGMGVFGGQKRVVEIEFAHRDPIGPGRSLRRVGAVDAKDHRPLSRPMCLGPGHCDRPTRDRCGTDRGVVDDPIDHHCLGLRGYRHAIGGYLRDLPGQVLGTRKIVSATVRSNGMDQHDRHTTQPG